jgi:hypothetical protein
MPTRKQRRRDLKSKRHQYEFVYVDADGNELDEAPPELLEQEEQRKKERTNGAKSAASTKGKKQAPQRGRREPQPPSWNRALKRSAILAVFFLVLISFSAHGNLAAAVIPTIPFVLLYVPLMYYMDRWMYRRYQAKQLGGGTPATRKKA